MPKRKGVKTKKKKAPGKSLPRRVKAGRVLAVKKKARNLKAKRIARHEDEPFTMFDSNQGNIDNLFSASEDLTKETIVTFADFKNENPENLENSLKDFGFKFCEENCGVSETPRTEVQQSETPQAEKPASKSFWKKLADLVKKILPKNLFGSILMGLVFAGLFSAVFYAMAVWSGSPYTPGETTNPECDPAVTDCTVTASVPYTGATAALNLGARNFSTSGTGGFGALTATSLTLSESALTVGNGGTGLGSIAVGSILGANSANVLTAITSATGTKVLTNTSGTISWETSSAPDLSGYVPYTGATAGLNLGSQILTTTGGVKTGVIYPSADSTTAVQINKADGTTNVLNVDTTNARVGIGTTTPGYSLDVNGDIRGNYIRTIGGPYMQASSTTGYLMSSNGWYISGDSGNNYLSLFTNTFYPNTSSISLGTASNTWTALYTRNATISASAAASIPLTVKAAADQTANLQEWQNSAGTAISQINSDGSLQIGAGTPLTGGQARAILIAPTTGAYYLAQSTSNGIGTILGADESATGFVGTISNSRFDIRTNNATKITVLADGKVGIGVATPATKLDVNGDAQFNGVVYVNSLMNYSSSVTHYDRFYLNNSNNGFWSSQGNIKIGIDSANGTTDAYFSINNNNYDYASVNELFRVQENGNVGIGVTAFGTNAATVLGLGNGTAPTTSITGTQIWSSASGLNIMGSGNTGTVLIPNAVTGTVALTSDLTGYLLATGATTGATSQKQVFTNGVQSGTPTTADALADVMIGASATTQKGLVIQGKASQTANLAEFQNSAGVAQVAIDSKAAGYSANMLLKFFDTDGTPTGGISNQSGLNLYSYSSGFQFRNLSDTYANLYGKNFYAGAGGSSYSYLYPGNLLIVNSTAATVPLAITGANGQSGHLVDITGYGGTAGNLFSIDSAGKVGIGTTSPNYALDVNGTIGVGHDSSGATYDSTISHSSSSPYKILTLASTGGANGWRGAINFDMNYSGGSVFTAMTIRTNVGDTANVGIGTTAPDNALEINGATGGVMRLTYNDSNGSATDYSTLGVGASGLTTLTTVDSDGTAGHIALMPDGNVGIGIAAPTVPLDVVGAIKSSTTINAVTGFRINDAATTGTILRGNGTNYVASTATYPDTITANQVLYATGANALGGNANLIFDGNTLTANSGTTHSILATGYSYTDAIGSSGSGEIRLGTNATYQGVISYKNATGELYIGNTYDNDAGNIHFVTKIAGTDVTAMTILGSGNVGIGVTPNATFDVKAGANISSEIKITASTVGYPPILTFFDAETNAGARNWGIQTELTQYGDFAIRQSTAKDGNPISAGTTRFYIDPSGKVGIGTTAPENSLQVGNEFGVNEGVVTWGTDIRAASRLAAGYLSYDTGNVIFGAITASDVQIGTPYNTPRITILTANGNVGIGTTAPTYLLSLSGQAAQEIWMERQTTAATAGNNLTLQSGGAKSGGTNLGGGSLYLSSGISTGNSSSDMFFQTATAGSSGTSDNTPTTKMTITGAGNVGVGTTAPTGKLHINDATSGQRDVLWVSGGDASGVGQGGTIVFNTGVGSYPTWRMAEIQSTFTNAANYESKLSFFTNTGATATNSTVKMTILGSGNVGIGIATPKSLLNLARASTTGYTTADSYLHLGYAEYGVNSTRLITFGYAGGTNPPAYMGYVENGTLAGDTKGALVFGTRNVTTDTLPTERMRITEAGYIGIGTAVPDKNVTMHMATDQNINFYAHSSIPAITAANDGFNNYVDLKIDGLKLLLNTVSGGNVGIGVTNPTAVLHLKAGTTAASTAPLKFTSGTNLTTAEAGAMEFDGTNLYFSPSTTRHTISLHPTVAATSYYSYYLAGAGNITATGQYNTANGYQALNGVGTANANTAYGYKSLYSNITGVNNTAVGYQALYTNTGADNTAIGLQSLYKTTGTDNTGVGNAAGYDLTTGNFNVIIGSYVDPASNTASGQLNIGNLLYGTGLYQTAAVSSTPVTDGKIGIMTASPTNALSFGGNAARKIWMERNAAGAEFPAGNDLTLQSGGTTSGTTNGAGGSLYLSSGISTGSSGSVIFFQTATGGSAGTSDNAPTIKMMISTAGNVGIGTIIPTNALSFGGNAERTIWLERNTTTHGSNLTMQAGGGLSGGTNLNGGSLYLSSGISTGSGSSDMFFQTATAGGTGTTDATPTTKFTVRGNGDVVVGTGTALATNATSGFLYIPSSAGTPVGTPVVDTTGTVPIQYDTTNNALYAYRGGGWRAIAETGGFQIPDFETADPISGEKMEEGDFVLGMIDKTMPNDNLHGIWVKWDSVKAQLLAEARGELSQTGTWGEGAISDVQTETLLDRVTNVLTSLGITFKDGVTNMTSLAVQNFTVKNSDTEIARIKKMEMVDADNGEIYCTWIAGGQWVKIKGNCDSSAVATAPVTQLETSEVNTASVQQISQQAVEQAAKDAVKEAKEEIKQEVKQEVKEELKQEAQQPENAENPETEAQAPAELVVAPSEEPATQELPQPSPEASAGNAAPEQTVVEEASPVSFIGEIIRNSTAGLINAIWEFTSGIFNLGIKKISSVPFVKNAAASILQNSEELKSSGLLSPKAEAFTANLYSSVDRLFKASAKLIGK